MLCETIENLEINIHFNVTGDEAQGDVEVTQGGSESEGSFSDSGVRVSEEIATPSPDAAILGELEKVIWLI